MTRIYNCIAMTQRKELNMANTNCVWVQNEYYSVVDADEELLENTELQELTEEEINNYIGEQYYDIDTGFSQTFKEQTVNGVAKTSSNSRAKQYNVDMTDVSTLKVSLVVIEYASRVTVSVTYTWDTMPKYRQIDVAGIAWGGMACYEIWIMRIKMFQQNIQQITQ